MALRAPVKRSSSAGTRRKSTELLWDELRAARLASAEASGVMHSSTLALPRHQCCSSLTLPGHAMGRPPLHVFTYDTPLT